MKLFHNKIILSCAFLIFLWLCYLALIKLVFPYTNVEYAILDTELAQVFSVDMHRREGLVVGHGQTLFSSRKTKILARGRMELQLSDAELPISLAESNSKLYVAAFDTSSGGYRVYQSVGDSWIIIDRVRLLENVSIYEFLPNVVMKHAVSGFFEDYNSSSTLRVSIGGFYSWLKTGRGGNFEPVQILTPEEFAIYKNRMDRMVIVYKQKHE